MNSAANLDVGKAARRVPPYSYSQLIILAMKESTRAKMTLQMIYDWILENFSSFKNSIRHNLSLNKCFRKIARQKDEPGKGGFWTLEPDFKKQAGEGGGPRAAETGKADLEKNEGLSAVKRRRAGVRQPRKMALERIVASLKKVLFLW